MKKTPAPSQVLKRNHQWSVWGGALRSAVLGLAISIALLWSRNPSLHAPESWNPLGIQWISALMIALLAAILFYLRSRKTLSHSARSLDSELPSKNRLEAAANLMGSASPYAEAHRSETTAFLASQVKRGMKPSILWLTAALVLLVAAHLGTFAIWSFKGPPLSHKNGNPKGKKEPPTATIKWISPEQETKANKIEEVPAVALVDSSSGLGDLSLEVSVNGEYKKNLPLPDNPAIKPGSKRIEISLLMDELEVEPYDMVSYYLKGRRVYSEKLPETVSPIQFIQVRPFRDDANKFGNAKNSVELIVALKVMQLRHLKDNFVLSTTELPKTDPLWQKENSRVGRQQKELSEKTGEVIDLLIKEGADAEIIDLLTQARSFMEGASKEILNVKNKDALSPQGKSLGLITQTEKKIRKVLELLGKAPPSPPHPDDPFKDKQKFEANKRRPNTPGCRLEDLARAQVELAQQLAAMASPSDKGEENSATSSSSNSGEPGKQSPSDHPMNGENGNSQTARNDSSPMNGNEQAPDKDYPYGKSSAYNKLSPAEKQQALADALEGLAGENNFSPEVQDAMSRALADAKESAHRVRMDDLSSAHEPAMVASQELKQAVALMDAQGKAQAIADLEKAQRELNAAAQQAMGNSMPSHDRDSHAGPAGGNQPQGNSSHDQGSSGQGGSATPPGPGNVVADLRKEVAAAESFQVEKGSLEAAKKLQEFGDELDHPGTGGARGGTGKDQKPGLGGLSDQLDDLARSAAAKQLELQSSSDALAEILNKLQGARANLNHLAGAEGPTRTLSKDQLEAMRESREDLQTSLQKLTATTGGGEFQSLISPLMSLVTANNVTAYRQIASPLDQLIDRLSARVNEAKRQEILASFHPEEAPLSYRDSVAEYYEILSKDYQKPPREPENQPAKKN